MTAVTRWSYKIVKKVTTKGGVETVEEDGKPKDPPSSLSQCFRELGGQGWECVGCDSSTNEWVFKRPNGSLTV